MEIVVRIVFPDLDLLRVFVWRGLLCTGWRGWMNERAIKLAVTTPLPRACLLAFPTLWSRGALKRCR